MKKMLSLLCACLLLMTCVSAGADEQMAKLPGVYMLAGVAPDGEATLLGTAALLGDRTTLITDRWAAETEHQLVAVGTDGTIAVAEKTLLHESSGLMVLTLEEPSAMQPLALGASEESMTCVAATSSGLTLQQAQHVTLTGYEDEPALLYTGVPLALPGALLLNSQGQIAGITAAGYGEGIDRYVAWSADVIEARMKGEAPAAAVKTMQWIDGLTVTADLGEMTADWSGLVQPETAGEGSFHLIWRDTGNHYVSYAQVQWEDGKAVLACVPGREYWVWLQQSPDDQVHLDQALPEIHAAKYAVPDAVPYTVNSFRDTSIYLGAAPVSHVPAADEAVPPLQAFTPESLTAADTCYYLQATSTYRVEEQQELPLVIALKAPDGSMYTYMGGFIFMPELNENDTWNADITGVVANCMDLADGMAGEYSLAYYLGGQMASEFRFTLE